MRVVVALAAVAFLAACQPAPRAEAPPADVALDVPVVQEVRTGVAAMLESWAAAGREGRWDEVAALYADDPGFAWVERGAVRYPSRVAAVEGLHVVTGQKIQSQVTNIAVTPLSADAAAFRSNVTFAFNAGGTPVELKGVITGVAVRRDGAWRFLQAHVEAAETPR
jgi:hypothetical protein